MVAAGRLIPVRVGDIEIEVEAVPVAGTEATSGRAEKAAESVLEAFGRAQDAIIEVAKSTAQMIEKAGAAARPDRVEVEFGLKFSVSGTVIMAGVAGEASLKVTLGYDVTASRQASRLRWRRRHRRACRQGRRLGHRDSCGGRPRCAGAGVPGPGAGWLTPWGRVSRWRRVCW